MKIAGIHLSGGAVPSGTCQPPADIRKLLRGLDPSELFDVAETMAIWSPEAFEHALRSVSAERAADVLPVADKQLANGK